MAEPRAHEATCTVVEESGRFVVWMTVLFDDEVVRHRIRDYPTRRAAEIAASMISRTANRDIDLPPGGLA